MVYDDGGAGRLVADNPLSTGTDKEHHSKRLDLVDGHRGGVDGGEQAGIGGVSDGQSDFSGAADGVSDEVASSVHF